MSRISLYHLAQLAHNCMVDSRTNPELFVDSSTDEDDAIVLQNDDQNDDTINLHRRIDRLQLELLQVKIMLKEVLRKLPK